MTFLTPFDTLNTGENPRGEVWRFKELCGEFCEELETSFTLKTLESLFFFMATLSFVLSSTFSVVCGSIMS